jgi:YVTN family beta-propeller protein
VITIAMATAVLLLAHAQRDDRVAPATVPPRPHVVATGDRILGAAGPRGTTAGRARSHPINVYAHDRPHMLTGAARRARPLIYVPNSGSNTVDVINPATRRVIRQFPVGLEPQHVVPSWDLKRLYVTNDQSNTLTPINPVTGWPGRPIPVADPYNLYFTPDGTRAIVVAERLGRLDFRDPHTFRLIHSLRVPCAGVDHIDFSASGRYLLATCEFSGQILKVEVKRERVIRTGRCSTWPT